MGGYTHVHVNGNAQNVMCYDAGRREIISFTGHIDSSGPGKAECAASKRAFDDAGTKGWVWVAVHNGTLYRLTGVK